MLEELKSTMGSVEGPRRYGQGSQSSPRNVHGYEKMTPLEKSNKAGSQDSLDRSLQRRVPVNRKQRLLLENIGESRQVWFQMRRHGSKKQVEAWLQLALENSTWKEDRKSPEESLRRQYLQLFQECCYHDAEFVDEEMQKRKRQAAEQEC